MVQHILKEFCQKTSIHGLSYIVDAKSSLIKRIAWFAMFVISISYAGIQLKGNVDSKLTLSMWQKIMQIRNILRKQLKVWKVRQQHALEPSYEQNWPPKVILGWK